MIIIYIFSNIKNQYEKKTDKCYKEYIRSVGEFLCENLKYFWKYNNDFETNGS